MAQVQFFLFALFVIWFANTGKLRALWTALRSAPSAPSAPATTGGGNPFDLNNPRNVITGDPLGLNR